jgi:hypothetical protein
MGSACEACHSPEGGRNNRGVFTLSTTTPRVVLLSKLLIKNDLFKKECNKLRFRPIV